MVVSVQVGEPPEYCFRVWQFQERTAYDVFIEGDGKLLIGRLAQPNIGSRQPTEAINQDVGVQQYHCRDCFHACSRSVRARMELSGRSVRPRHTPKNSDARSSPSVRWGFGWGFSGEHDDDLRRTGRNLLRDADGQRAFRRDCSCECDNAHVCIFH